MKTHTTSLKAKFNSAFSLVELLVVIAVIAVIAAIAIPNITGAREAAVASQTAYNEQALTDMQNKVEALTGSRPTAAQLETGVSVTNGTNVISFRLQ